MSTSPTPGCITKQTIYVSLLDEGTPCYRPVEAILKQGDIYTIISNNSDPEDEHWEFICGDDVRCKVQTFSGGNQGLVAYAKLS